MRKKIIWWILLVICFIFVTLSIKKLLIPFVVEIVDTVEKSIAYTNNGLLVIAAVKTVIYEGIKDLPVFLFAYSFTFYYFREIKLYYKLLLLISITILLYIFNIYIYNSKLEVLILIFIIFCQLILMSIFHKSKENFLANIFILIQLNFAFYGLLITTVLNEVGVGYRDLVTNVKISAEFLEGNTILNFVSLSFVIPFILGAVLVTLLTIMHSRRLASEKREKQKERELRMVKLVAEEAQVWQELHYLVHDLKSPLMTMAGLNSLIEMQVVKPQIKEYCRRINEAIENIDEMISEFLNNEKRRTTSVEELIKFVRAHVVIKNADPQVLFEIQAELPNISINRIRMSRALINIIENAIRVVSHSERPLIKISVHSDNQNKVIFSVEDNGIGISDEDIEKIWNVGFTTKGTSGGLGMSFVKKVIEDHGGEIKVYSKLGQGTEVIIILPGVKKNDSNINYRG